MVNIAVLKSTASEETRRSDTIEQEDKEKVYYSLYCLTQDEAGYNEKKMLIKNIINNIMR